MSKGGDQTRGFPLMDDIDEEMADAEAEKAAIREAEL